MQMKAQTVTDSGKRWQGKSEEMEARKEIEAGNTAGVPSTVCLVSQRGKEDPAAAVTERPNSQHVENVSRTCPKSHPHVSSKLTSWEVRKFFFLVT